MFEGSDVGRGALWDGCPQPVCGDPHIHAFIDRRGVGEETKVTRR